MIDFFSVICYNITKNTQIGIECLFFTGQRLHSVLVRGFICMAFRRFSRLLPDMWDIIRQDVRQQDIVVILTKGEYYGKERK